MAVSLAALFVALGGTSYAAFALPKNSVGTKQLKNGAVTTKKIKNGAVTNSKIANGAVTASKINTAGLTVPNALHASSADNATTATNASTANNANHATTADTARAAAYAHVPTNGALDTVNSKNVSAAKHVTTGVYCLNVTVPVTNMTGAADAGTTAAFAFVSGVLSSQDPSGFIPLDCGAGFNAIVGVSSTSGNVDEGFWVSFN